MKNISVPIIAFLLFALSDLSAQHLPLFTQYRDHLSLLNPAAVSGDYLVYEQSVTIGASYRRQWVGLEAGPETQTLHGTYLHAQRESMSWQFGGHLLNDQTGPTGFTGLYGRISGILTDDPYFGGLSFGLSFGAVQYRVKATEIRLREENDILTATDQAQMYPDFGLGLFAYRRIEGGLLDGNQVYAGLSVPQVFGLDLQFEDEEGTFSTQRVQHYYGLLGMYAYLSDDSFLEPSAWIKYVPGAPVNVDLNLRYQMQSNFWIGTGLSTARMFHLELGYLAFDFLTDDSIFRIGYGFDYAFRDYGPAAGSTHEINISFAFGG